MEESLSSDMWEKKMIEHTNKLRIKSKKNVESHAESNMGIIHL